MTQSYLPYYKKLTKAAFLSIANFLLPIAEFLGRTELSLSNILSEKSKQAGGGPLTKNLPLFETESGHITVRLDLQLFSNDWASPQP